MLPEILDLEELYITFTNISWLRSSYMGTMNSKRRWPGNVDELYVGRGWCWSVRVSTLEISYEALYKKDCSAAEGLEDALF